MRGMSVHCIIVLPTPSQYEVGCDGCRTTHRKSNKWCSANMVTKRNLTKTDCMSFIGKKIYRKVELTDINIARGRTSGTAVLKWA